MSIVFYVIGVLTTAVGGWWLLTALSALRTTAADQTTQGLAVISTLVAAAPGFSVMMSGLVLLALGGVLSRLDSVVRYSRQAARTLKDIQTPTE